MEAFEDETVATALYSLVLRVVWVIVVWHTAVRVRHEVSALGYRGQIPSSSPKYQVIPILPRPKMPVRWRSKPEWTEN